MTRIIDEWLINGWINLLSNTVYYTFNMPAFLVLLFVAYKVAGIFVKKETKW